MNTLKQMGGGYVGEIEGRVLAQQHHVESGQLDPARIGQSEEVAGDVAHAQGLDTGEDVAIEQSQPVGGVIRERMAAGLRFQKQGEG